MSQSEKIKQIEELFKRMQEIMPETPMGLTIHNIDFDDIPEGYEVSPTMTMGDRQKKYAVSTMGNPHNYVEISLFERVK